MNDDVLIQSLPLAVQQQLTPPHTMHSTPGTTSIILRGNHRHTATHLVNPDQPLDGGKRNFPGQHRRKEIGNEAGKPGGWEMARAVANAIGTHLLCCTRLGWLLSSSHWL